MLSARHDFPTAMDAATALAADIAETLNHMHRQKPRALVALSGGRSPETVLPRLAAADVDWSLVDVTLSDERWVPSSDPASNAAMIERCFLKRGGGDATFYPLWTADTAHADGPARADARLSRVTMPPDIIYLGLGEDGHIASLFPADTDAGFFASNGYTVATLAGAKYTPQQRISLDLPTLLGAATIYLHFGGAAKASVFESALKTVPPSAALPLGLIVHGGHPDIRVFSFAS